MVLKIKVMKNLPNILTSLAFMVLCFACTPTKNTTTGTPTPTSKIEQQKSDYLIPLQLGNYWVYQHKNFMESTRESRPDTIKVIEVTIDEDIIDYKLSNNSVWVTKDEIIHKRCWGRGLPTKENSFYMPLYFRVTKTTSFEECKGDYTTEATITPIGNYELNGTTYQDCYLMTKQRSSNKLIIADGVGIIKEEYIDQDGKPIGERILVANHLVKK